MPRAFVAFVALVVALAPAFAEDRPAMKSKGWLALYRGDYKGAQKAFDDDLAKSPDDLSIVLGINRLRIEIGEYEAAEKHLTEFLARKDHLLVRRLLVKVLFLRGKREAVAAQAKHVLEQDPVSSFGNVTRGRIDEEAGRYDDAEQAYQRVFDWFFEHPELTEGDGRNPEVLCDVAYAGARLGTRIGDSGTLQITVDQVLPAATAADKYCYDAYLMEAFLYLEKGNPLDASKTFKQIMDFNKYHPEVRVGMAMYHLEKGALDEAEREVARALKINPNLVPAHQLQAMLHLFDEEFEPARAELDKALAVNPNDVDTIALLGALFQYMTDEEQYQAYEKRALALNPRSSAFYHRVGQMCLRTLRFAEADKYLQKAVELDPKDWSALHTLGMSLLHQGREKEAYKTIEQAFGNDSFQAEAFNTLKLLDDMQENYVDHEEGKFHYRFEKSEEPVLRPYVSKLVAEADATLGKKYGIDPEGPILVEMFRNYQDFSVRTAGVVGIGALGACFGKVCTLLSPAGHKQFGVYNWARVAWHEYAHVVTLQKSKGRVPRWFTEGLSVYEEKQHRAAWAREMELELLVAHRRGQTLGLGELNRGFTRPKFPEQVILCYFQASLVCEFIEKDWGFPAIVDMLTAYAGGLRTPEVVKQVLKVEIPEFDRRFFAWLDAKLGAMKVPPIVPDEEKEALDQRVAADAKDAVAHARLAWYHLHAGDGAAAKTSADKALEIDPKNADAHTALGYLAHEAGKTAPALEHLKAALAAGADYYGVHVRLGALLKSAKEFPEAIGQFEAAKKCYANRADRENNPYYYLAQIYETQGDAARQLAELEALRGIDQDDADVRQKLAGLYAKQGKHEEALAALLEANEVFPLGDELHVKLAQTHRALKKWDEALAEYEVAVGSAQAANKRGVNDEKIANLYCEMAEIAIDKPDLDDAERYVDDAEYLFPKLTRGADLRKKIEGLRKQGK